MKNISPMILVTAGGAFLFSSCQSRPKENSRPNILIAISDDQSFAHTGFAGCKFVTTPGFDRIAREGIYFTNCWSGSPGSAPSRSSLVTGRYHWQNEQSGQHASSWMKKYVPFTDELEWKGYHTGFTGKGVGPFQYARDEKDSLWRKEDAAGRAYNRIKYQKDSDERTADGISPVNYFANFREFMSERKAGQPFCFWYGAHEPHRAYEEGSWRRNALDPAKVDVPGFLPDDKVVREDMLDYAVEINWFDVHLTRILNYLDSVGELDNTIVIVTGDNGMPFPRAKANFYEYGIHVPLAIRYPAGFPGSRKVEDPVSFTDLAPTILEMTGTVPGKMMPMSGKSIVNILKSKKSGIIDKNKKYVFAGRERHSSSRWNNLGYPARAVRSRDFMLVWNMMPGLWPAGDPQALKEDGGELLPVYGIDENGKHHSEWAFTDVDASPSKSWLIEHHNDEGIQKFFDLSFQKRPEFELYDVVKDPFCLENLAGKTEYSATEQELKTVLLNELKRSGDPRVTGPVKDIFETYPRFSPIRYFPAPAETRVVNPGEDFYKAALEGNETVISGYLREGVAVNVADNDSRTALMYAAFNGHAEILKMLLEKGASVDLRDFKGSTALMLASSGPYPEAVKILLENHADPDLYDKEEHFTPLMYAASEGHLENVKILLQSGANPMMKDVDGDNALTFAKNNNHKEVVDYLSKIIK